MYVTVLMFCDAYHNVLLCNMALMLLETYHYVCTVLCFRITGGLPL